jgi:UDP-N-acetylglucosamine 4-epimerase
LRQIVIGCDNFSTGTQANLKEVQEAVGAQTWENFTLVEVDIRDAAACLEISQNVDFILHQAALGSVSLSLYDPKLTHEVNVNGFMNIIQAARINKVRRFVYASSCAIYGDSQDLPLAENTVPRPLSPYAASKACNEMYAQAFSRSFPFSSVGLRYFNVYGARQSPDGAYAAVIPKWIHAMLKGEIVEINGDGANTRDFIHVGTVVDSNISAALLPEYLEGEVLNVASGYSISLNDLFNLLKSNLRRRVAHPIGAPLHGAPRPGDIKHSGARIDYACKKLRIEPVDIATGIEQTLAWYGEDMQISSSRTSNRGQELFDV